MQKMKKVAIIVIFLAIIVSGGIYYRKFFLPEEKRAIPESGKMIEITIRAIENKWQFEPDYFEVKAGDKVVLNVFNDDEYDHGLAIEAFGINKRMPSKSKVRLEFIANRLGEFPFYCSVSCGSGIVNGKKRSHFDMVGKFLVK